ncbi:MAG: recombinase family protein [bacterium]
MPKLAIGYIRVSTEEQVREGQSLDNQAARIREYCQFRALELVDVICDEGISGGTNRKRHGFNDLLDRIEAAGIDAVVLYSLERLSRDMLTLLALEKYLDEFDVELHTIEGTVDTSTPDGFMAFAMKAFLGEMERRQVKYRTKKSMEHLKGKNRLVGGVTYGYRIVTGNEGGRKVKMLAPNLEEQRILKVANRLYESGKTLKEVVTELNKRGYRSRGGKVFLPMQVKRMLENYQSRWTARKGQKARKIRDFISTIG